VALERWWINFAQDQLMPASIASGADFPAPERFLAPEAEALIKRDQPCLLGWAANAAGAARSSRATRPATVDQRACAPCKTRQRVRSQRVAG
jgi:hypothetical protein